MAVFTVLCLFQFSSSYLGLDLAGVVTHVMLNNRVAEPVFVFSISCTELRQVSRLSSSINAKLDLSVLCFKTYDCGLSVIEPGLAIVSLGPEILTELRTRGINSPM